MKVFSSVQLCWCLLSVAGTASTNTTAQARDDSCPPWKLRSNSTGVCSCDTQTFNSVIICYDTPYELLLQECYCITFGQDTLAVGPCEYTCQRAGMRGFYFNATVTSTSLINNYICGTHRRTRQMCGGCMSGYAPPVYSYSPTCVNCTTSNLGKYTAVSFLPLTAFFIFVITFRISAFSPKLHGFILFSQILTCPSNMRHLERCLSKFTPVLKVMAKACASFFGMWNLDFFRSVYSPFCLNPHTDTLHVMALDYLIAIYPLLLIGLSYLLVLFYDHNVRLVVFLCKPFVSLYIRFRRQWNIRNSLIDAFATFFLLSYVKILSVSVDLLLPVALYDERGQPLPQLYLFNQGDVAFFSSKHLPYACLALFFLLTFTLLPMALLFLYPCSCFQVCLNRTGLTCQTLHIFMDTFQGHYKNGTNGTRDFRYFSALYLLLRGTVYAFTVLAYLIFSYDYTVILLLLFYLLLALAQPYRKYTYFVQDNIFLVLIIIVYLTIMQNIFAQSFVTQRAINTFSICLVILAIIGIFVLNISFHKCPSKCLKRKKEEEQLIPKDNF